MTLKLTLVLLIWTCVGQYPINGKSLERHYHERVNSQTFQTTFWRLATPVTWTKSRIEYLIAKWNPKETPQAR